jgi:hypothetical protein
VSIWSSWFDCDYCIEIFGVNTVNNVCIYDKYCVVVYNTGLVCCHFFLAARQSAMLASTPSGISPWNYFLMCRVQEYPGDQICFDIDHRFLDNYLTAHPKAVHPHPDSTTSAISVAMVEDSCVDG